MFFAILYLQFYIPKLDKEKLFILFILFFLLLWAQGLGLLVNVIIDIFLFYNIISKRKWRSAQHLTLTQFYVIKQ